MSGPDKFVVQKYASVGSKEPFTAAFLGLRDLVDATDLESAKQTEIKDIVMEIKISSLKIIFGTDALAGMHGHNVEDLINRVVESGIAPMDALVSANSLAAEAMKMDDQIGALAPGLEADIIALDGDPLKDITVVRRVAFVMKGGSVYKNEIHPMPRSRWHSKAVR